MTVQWNNDQDALASAPPTPTPDVRARFERTWASATRFPDWFSEVSNQPLGRRFMVTAFAFFVLGGILALLMRTQLIVSEFDLIGPQLFNELFTMHGSTMMFLFAVPFLEGLALYLLPLMIGSRDMAFPRLSAFGYWTYLFGGIIFYVSFLFGTVPDSGWFSYVPLSGPRFADKGMDFWLLGLGLVEIGGIAAGVEIVVTILKCRASGMSLGRMPLFAWTMLIAAVMILFAFTTLFMATVLLELDRAVGTRFFDDTAGGSALLWQHLFWFFGHPEVYIIFLPATGIVSMVVATAARRAMAGYTLVVVAIIVTGFVSFGLWVHHMFATGLPELSLAFFTAASLMISIASGTQVFAWIATLWGSRPILNTAMLYVLGFLFIFVIGGMTGVMIAVVPFDWQVHDTYFIVAHFHYVLIGGAVFPIFAGLHYWVPKMTGRMLSERLGKWSFWITFIAFNVTFFPMHVMGLLGMPRRVFTYPRLLGLDGYNVVATIGSYALGVGFMLFVINFFWSRRRGAPAGDNPWGAGTLEWLTPSPPPNYGSPIPVSVRGRQPLWQPPPREIEGVSARVSMAMAWAPMDWRATLVTDPVDAQPQAIQHLPGPTYFPFIASIGLLVVALGTLFDAYLIAAAGVAVALYGLLQWLWPRQDLVEMLRDTTVQRESHLSVTPTGHHALPWWGAVSMVAIIATAAGVLEFAYFYLRLYSDRWPQDGLERQWWLGGVLVTVVLLTSIVTQWLASRGQRYNRTSLSRAMLVATFLIGLGCCLGILFQISRLPFPPRYNAYASAVHVMLGFAALLLLGGLFVNVAAHVRLNRGMDSAALNFARLQMQITSLVWNAIAIAAAFLLATVYLAPYLI